MPFIIECERTWLPQQYADTSLEQAAELDAAGQALERYVAQTYQGTTKVVHLRIYGIHQRVVNNQRFTAQVTVEGHLTEVLVACYKTEWYVVSLRGLR